VVYAATKSAVDSIHARPCEGVGGQEDPGQYNRSGGVETEGLHRVGIIGSDFEKQVVAETPLGRFGQPEDIARVAVFLASEDAGWLTGERITASGGWR
jgi:3-oxoacyl-[acyl-carrier protein] reductase